MLKQQLIEYGWTEEEADKALAGIPYECILTGIPGEYCNNCPKKEEKDGKSTC